MRILFIGLGSIFTEGLHYQDNYLFEIAKENHEVLYVADNRKFVNGVVSSIEVTNSIDIENGVLRRKLLNFGFDSLTNTIRYMPGLIAIIDEFSPDIIFHHSIQSASLITIKNYKRRHPDVLVFADNHADAHNSAMTIFSKALHFFFYRFLINYSLSAIDKIFYISYESKLFIDKYYNVNQNKLSSMPLGGLILSTEEYNKRREAFREKYGITSLIYSHSGKLDAGKRTYETIKAFIDSNTNNHLFIAGVMTKDIENLCSSEISMHSNIHYIGWQDEVGMLNLLCATDLYIQLGVQSATMQNALCCNCAVALFPHKSHEELLGSRYFKIKNQSDLSFLLKSLDQDKKILNEMRNLDFEFAKNHLDYRRMFENLTSYLR